jgi:hypothetical protein
MHQRIAVFIKRIAESVFTKALPTDSQYGARPGWRTMT